MPKTIFIAESIQVFAIAVFIFLAVRKYKIYALNKKIAGPEVQNLDYENRIFELKKGWPD